MAEQKKTDKKAAEEEQKIIYMSKCINNEVLYEQIYKDGKHLFVYMDKEKGLKYINQLQPKSEVIKPIIGEEVELGALKMPSGATDYGNTQQLINDIEVHIYKYLDLSDNFRKFAAYYVLLSWLYDRFRTIPYLRAIGDTGVGKSRFLDVIGGLCYKPISASGCVTPAPMYRLIRRWAGTLIIDEADLKNSDEYSEIVTILNCGFETNRPVIRSTKDNPDKVQFLPTYGPKILATRRRFQDAALEARCLTEIMTETARDDIPVVLGKEFYQEEENLRNKLLLFRLNNYFSVDPDQKVNLDLKGIEPRLRQISSAFSSLFANEPSVLKDYKEFIGKHQQEVIEQRLGSPAGQVVEKMFMVMNSLYKKEGLKNGDILNITSTDIADRTGLSPNVVGQILKTLGVEVKLKKYDGVAKRRIVYYENTFNLLKRRYISEEGNEVTAVTAVTGNRQEENSLLDFSDMARK
ncbi:hypothetical protein SYNTR_0703 [Candidatus Syntrophocurvum alkaliphilum]|uniref:DUF927 domain-containing protein n=1 Tax=Candidatus Syntrophocurvum alkaliphilum TaxID=2293317 RepID=A0A6I6DDC6_9FIRM|nr:hypothetical protein [Candidatus Syntrophocurvum alkaliphilum]QGT99296.1 hypothetical protein SYNTR_0703 [Candidatus Syntrophocurvum alkaliphilum]